MKLLIFLAVFACCSMAVAQTTGAAESRLRRMGRGINLSHWWAQSISGQYDDERLGSYIVDADFALIAKMGFDHVRFTVNPAVLMVKENPTTLHPAKLALFDEAMRMMLGHGLVVVVDMHPQDEFKKQLSDDPAFADAFVRFWGALAGHLNSTDPDRVLLEVLNEPSQGDDAAWHQLQGRLLTAMRAAAPNHTLIATPNAYSSIDKLTAFTPYSDANILYTFHDYDPAHFTHQGASWGWPMWRHFRNLPYPGSPQAVEAIIDQQQTEEAKQHVRAYGQMNWNADSQRALIERAVAWADQHRVAIYCGEFGVYRRYSNPADRARYLADLVMILNEHEIPWAMWDYAGGFAVVNGDGAGQRTGDELTLRALGLGAGGR